MRKTFVLAAAVAATVLTFIAGPANAQATRTWVSGNGSDSNPCSYTLPCKTFAGAIGQTAAGGEIDALSPGGYGVVTITKSITIDGSGGGLSSVLNSGTNGITISGSGVVVTLRHLAINGAGSGLAGISFTNGAQLNVIDCEIQGSGQYGINFAPSTTNSRLFVSNTTVHDNGGYGIVIVPSIITGTPTVATFDNVQSFHNGVGFAAFDNVKAMITRSNISTNVAVGVSIVTSSTASFVDMDETTISNNNGNGISLSLNSGGHPQMRISNTYISGNVGSSMSIPFGTDVTSFGNNRIIDNGTDTLPNITVSQH